MQALKIVDNKSFMSALLVHDTFYSFEAVEGEIVTFASFHFDGTLQRSYFDQSPVPVLPGAGNGTDTSSMSAASAASTRPEYVPWQLLQPHIYELIKGKTVPGRIRIVFRLSEADMASFASPFSLEVSDVAGLYMNILFEKRQTGQGSEETATVTTGTSLRIFTPDRSLEHAWDEHVGQLLHNSGLAYTN